MNTELILLKQKGEYLKLKLNVNDRLIIAILLDDHDKEAELRQILKKIDNEICMIDKLIKIMNI